MENVVIETSKDGKEIVVRMKKDHDAGISASGKSQMVATTHGNVPVPGHLDLRIGISLYRKNGEYKKAE